MVFAVCLFGTLVKNTWFNLPNDRAVIGFFGFGVPMAMIGLATALLWHGHKGLETILGWAGTMVGIAHAVAVLLLVVTRVLAETSQFAANASLTRFLAFGVAAFVSGAFGIFVLYQAEGKEL
jgi:hypothetical protein